MTEQDVGAVEIIQADRECAIRIMSDRWNSTHAAKVRRGDGDYWTAVQECASHRIAHTLPATPRPPADQDAAGEEQASEAMIAAAREHALSGNYVLAYSEAMQAVGYFKRLLVNRELDGGEGMVEAVWQALKSECCSDPAEAKRCVMVERRHVERALVALSTQVGETEAGK